MMGTILLRIVDILNEGRIKIINGESEFIKEA